MARPIDREKLRTLLPPLRKFEPLSNEDKKRALENAIDSFLDALIAEGREFDDWERTSICLALGAMLSGMYSLAHVQYELTLAYPRERSPEPISKLGNDLDNMTVARIRRALRVIRGMPA